MAKRKKGISPSGPKPGSKSKGKDDWRGDWPYFEDYFEVPVEPTVEDVVPKKDDLSFDKFSSRCFEADVEVVKQYHERIELLHTLATEKDHERILVELDHIWWNMFPLEQALVDDHCKNVHSKLKQDLKEKRERD